MDVEQGGQNSRLICRKLFLPLREGVNIGPLLYKRCPVFLCVFMSAHGANKALRSPDRDILPQFVIVHGLKLKIVYAVAVHREFAAVLTPEKIKSL